MALLHDDRISSIGLGCGERNEFLALEEQTGATKLKLLDQFAPKLHKLGSSFIEGYNFFKSIFSDYLWQRCKRYKPFCAVASLWTGCRASLEAGCSFRSAIFRLLGGD